MGLARAAWLQFPFANRGDTTMLPDERDLPQEGLADFCGRRFVDLDLSGRRRHVVESAINALPRERSISRGAGERNSEGFAFPKRTIRTDQAHWISHRIECWVSGRERSQSDAFARRAWHHREIQSAGRVLATMATRRHARRFRRSRNPDLHAATGAVAD